MTNLGAIFLPSNPPEQLLEVARVADRSGLDQLWLWEDSFLNSGIAAAAAALGATERLKVGIGLMPVPFRNVALTAMEIATLHRIFGERSMPGVGHGVQEWMGQVGARAASPLTLLREHLTALRALLAGEEVTVDGRYVKLDKVKLDWPSTPAARVWVGATGVKTRAIAGELGDGTILEGGTPPEGVRTAIEQINPGPGHDIVAFVPAATGPGADESLARLQEKYGAAWPGLSGDAKAIAEGVAAFAAAGATTVVLQPTGEEESPESFVRFVAEEVRPLVA
ncbi:LLM class flavin-dependent oxidoreductase [Symbioplanes lichenis]|uniref:LLM class flavin-dependent oxidoreductase n=1 Tax=Symbioplanes lichenis TaxID=1629072 RepID=UPI0027396463|nr:LLM class flavin-dependent oxidoreductase [Actinoplanes lichenis]